MGVGSNIQYNRGSMSNTTVQSIKRGKGSNIIKRGGPILIPKGGHRHRF